MNKRIALDTNWKFSLSNNNNTELPGGIKKFTPQRTAEVPGTIHTDLLKNKLIDDPFYADNELRLQWISACDWQYETKFTVPENFDTAKPIQLVFDGLDTVADIFVNDKLVGSADNMFRSFSFVVNGVLQEKNRLKIIFAAPDKYARALEEQHGKLPVALNSERVYIRKAQYSFGWDWGPVFTTSGIWRGVFLENILTPEIDSLFLRTLKITGDSADIEIHVELSKPAPSGASLSVTLADDENAIIHVDISTAGQQEFVIPVTVEQPELWYPNGMGQQKLYTLHAELSDEQDIITLKQVTAGIRTVTLQLHDENSATFHFFVNGKPLFIKGANWIPAHSFLTVTADEDYRSLILKAKNSNMNMLRVWGGGIYENDVFYQLCDELGLLVWQDFMFACAAYPEYEAFVENVKQEAVYNIKRLRQYCSLAIWCGNNENEWNWYKEQHESYKNMPGHKLFAGLFPALIAELDPLTPYHVSTPFGEDDDPNSQTSGNRHQWDIWSGFTDYTEVENDRSLFVSEFGFQGPANMQTLDECIPKPERYIQSRLFEFHNKQVSGNERIIRFVAAQLPLETKWKDFIYIAQLNQGFAMKACLEHWRFAVPETNGAIIWQLNDCWPVTSWSLIDSEHSPKMAYYFVKNAFAPVALGFVKHGTNYKLMGMNDTKQDVTVNLIIGAVKPDKTKVRECLNRKIVLTANVCVALNIENCIDDTNTDTIYVATVYDDEGGILHRAFLARQPWKYFKLPQPGIKASITKKNKGYTVSLKAKRPAFFVDLTGDGLTFSDRGMILLPNEKITIEVESRHQQPPDRKDITIFSLNNYLE
ncbi:MAG: glycoside hydrolase family 2 protein [Ignavibacteriales bacterium]|nr:glycoside hydrolase family 2 protein [Ignavibacteriales bacterium]